MVRGIQHYHKKLRRHAIDGVTTRNILLEETAGVIQVIISEVRPTLPLKFAKCQPVCLNYRSRITLEKVPSGKVEAIVQDGPGGL
jgi:hypothetical protein